MGNPGVSSLCTWTNDEQFTELWTTEGDTDLEGKVSSSVWGHEVWEVWHIVRNMDLTFRKEGGSLNAEAEVTRAWSVFVAETCQTDISAYFSCLLGTHWEHSLQPPLQLKGHMAEFCWWNLSKVTMPLAGLAHLPPPQGLADLSCKGPDSNWAL